MLNFWNGFLEEAATAAATYAVVAFSVDVVVKDDDAVTAQ